MSATLDTSHSLIDPCGLLEQSPLGDNLRHVSTALLSCTLDESGTNAALRRWEGQDRYGLSIAENQTKVRQSDGRCWYQAGGVGRWRSFLICLQYLYLPPQECGEVPMKRISNETKRSGGDRICIRWYIVLIFLYESYLYVKWLKYCTIGAPCNYE